MNLNLDTEALYEEGPRVENQDLRLLKALVSDDNAARELSYTYDHTLFIGDARSFAESAFGYYKTYNQRPTERVMLEYAKESNSFEQFEEIWNKLKIVDYNPSEFKYDLDKIKKRFTKLQVSKLKDNIPDDLEDANLDSILQSVRANIDYTEKIRRGKEQAYTQKTLKEYIPEFRNEFVQKSKDPSLGRGILTGYSYLDYITNGLNPSDMLVIAGETGSGKSFFLANMAKQMWMQKNRIDNRENFSKGYNVLFFSLEMPFDQCAKRVISSMANVPTYSLRDCQITNEEQLARLSHSAKFIRDYPNSFEIVDIPRGVTVGQIEDRFLESIATGRRPDVVVIDYLGLMEAVEEDGEDWLRMGKMAGDLHEFTRAYNIVLLTAVQLNRPKSRKPEDTIGLHRIGRSSQIMHHATVGVQILTRENEEILADLEYHVIKNRHGERGKHSINKNFQTATLVDNTDRPYIPPNTDGSTIPIVMEDISDKLADLGW